VDGHLAIRIYNVTESGGILSEAECTSQGGAYAPGSPPACMGLVTPDQTVTNTTWRQCLHCTAGDTESNCGKRDKVLSNCDKHDVVLSNYDHNLYVLKVDVLNMSNI